MGPIGCPETSVRNYHYALRNNPEQCSSHLLRCGSLKSRLSSWFVEQLSGSREGLCCMDFSNCVCAKLEVLTATLLTIQVFWNVTLRRLVYNYHLTYTCLPAKGCNVTEGLNLHFVFFPRHWMSDQHQDTATFFQIINYWMWARVGFGAHCDFGVATAFGARGRAIVMSASKRNYLH